VSPATGGRAARRSAVLPHAPAPGSLPTPRPTRTPAAILPTGGAPPGELSLGYLATHRPEAMLAKANESAVKFTAGAVAGAMGKTATAPFDRLKLLMQVKGGLEGGAIGEAAARGSLLQSFVAIGRQEGLLGYWRGNAAQVVRVLPYSACQLVSYDAFKALLTDQETGELTVQRKLLAGAFAGMFSTVATYPLDTLRLRMAVDPAAVTFGGAVRGILRDGGAPAFYRGVGTALCGIAPYMALELGAFDSLPQQVPAFARGFAAALIATSVCYPLDTVRRQMQMARAGTSAGAVLRAALASEGYRGLYRGFLPNAVKNLPNKAIRLGVYDLVKKAVATSQDAYRDEQRRVPALN